MKRIIRNAIHGFTARTSSEKYFDGGLQHYIPQIVSLHCGLKRKHFFQIFYVFFIFCFGFIFDACLPLIFFFLPFTLKKNVFLSLAFLFFLWKIILHQLAIDKKKSVLNQQIFINELRVNDNLLRIHRVIRLISEYEKTQFIKETSDL